MEYKSFIVEHNAGLVTITLNQAKRGNPIDGIFCSEIADIANVLSVKKDVRAILFKSNGKVFSFGGDVQSFVKSLDELPLFIKKWTTDLHSAIARFQRMDAPIIAQVHSICAGGMVAFIAGADIVVASEDVKFLAAYSGIGFCCDAGSSTMFARRMGLARARRYLLLNETIEGEEALNIGLIDKLVSQEKLEGAALNIAQKLTKGPTIAYGHIKRLMLSAEDQPLETQLELEAQALSFVSGTQDAKEGLIAFSEKRRPVFNGQ